MTLHPQTPQSPCRFSPAATSSSCDLMAAAAAAAAAAPASASTLPTPAHSVNGANSQGYGAGEMMMMMMDDSPHKRKRALEDVGGGGDAGLKKMHLDDRRLGIENLHLDVGNIHLLCQRRPATATSTAFAAPAPAPAPAPTALAGSTSTATASHDASASARDASSPTSRIDQSHNTAPMVYPQPRPPLTQDLFEMFGLSGLAAEVAREKPNGEKNALRKTYKGHIKRLGVAGHFDVQKKKEGTPSDLLAMVSVPDLEWGVHQVKGREIGDGLSEATLSSLGRAMTMSKGPIPKSVWDSSVLGDLAPASQQDASRAASNTPSGATPHAAMMARSKSQTSPGHDPLRPRRAIKKRSYGDSSFEGYGEGFPDDDANALDTGGYSTGEGEGRQKRRKTASSPDESPPSYPSIRRQSYGPGMVGA